MSVVVFAGFLAINNTPFDTAFCESVGEYSTKAQSEEDIADFVRQFFFETDELYNVEEITIPYVFNDTYIKYNELQKKQGLDLEPFKGRTSIRYIYSLKNHKIDDTDAYITIIVYKGRVIAGHISTGVEGTPIYTFLGE